MLRRFTSPLIALLLSSAVVLPASADDFFLPGMSPMEIAQPYNAAESARIWGLSLQASQSRRPNASSNSFRPAKRSPATKTTGTSGDLSFQSSAAVRQQVAREFVDRVRSKNPAAADQVAAQLRQYDFGDIYTNLVRPYGLSSNNLADILTAYSVLNWTIANQATDPSAQAVLAERDRIGATLRKSPSLRDPQLRQQVGEEIKLLFVTLHAGWKTAERQGQLKQYSDGAAALFRQQSGADPRQIVLTKNGFRSRS